MYAACGIYRFKVRVKMDPPDYLRPQTRWSGAEVGVGMLRGAGGFHYLRKFIGFLVSWFLVSWFVGFKASGLRGFNVSWFLSFKVS